MNYAVKIPRLMAALSVIAVGLSTSFATDHIDLDGLIERVIANDIELEALRGRLNISREQVHHALPMRDPEIRLGYSKTSRSAVPPPYTETRNETVNERATRSSQGGGTESDRSNETKSSNDRSTRTGDNPVSEHRNSIEDSSASSRNSISFTEQQSARTTTHTETVREVIPQRNATVIKSVTRETNSRSFNERGTKSVRSRGSASFSETGSQTDIPLRGSGGSSPFRQSKQGASNRSGNTSSSITQQGNSQETVVSERIEERIFGRDPYEGSENYSVELRLHPRNPWELHRRVKQALSEVSLAEHLVESAERSIASEVCIQYNQLQELKAAAALHGQQLVQLEADMLFAEQRFAAQQMSMDDLAKLNVKQMKWTLERDEAQSRFEKQKAELAARAALMNPEIIHVKEAQAPRLLSLDHLNQSMLVGLATASHPQLGKLIMQNDIIKHRMSADKARAIPWLNFVSAAYDYEERYGDKYRDEYGVVAGFSLPVFTWFSSKNKVDALAIESLQRQRALLENRLEVEMAQHVDALDSAMKRYELFRGQLEKDQQQIGEYLTQLTSSDVRTREMRSKLTQFILQLKHYDLEARHRFLEEQIRFETLVGLSIDDLFNPAVPEVIK